MLEKSTYYILDAQGNQLSLYEHTIDAPSGQEERLIILEGDLANGASQTFNVIPGYQYTLSYALDFLAPGTMNLSITDTTTIATDTKTVAGNYSLSFIPNTSTATVHFGANSKVALHTIQINYHHIDTLITQPRKGGYRYGFQGQEKDDEVKGVGNSYDFGARFHDPRIGRFLSIDAYANKFASQSPYVFAGNMPIWAIDHNGDSVLFYSKSGDYLGYSHDNQRYKGKNLLVIIDDKQVDNFKNQYTLKRNAEYSSPQAREANVAGLEAMGTTYDVTSMRTFFNKYHDKKTDVNGKIYTEKDDTKQVEWGAKFKTEKNPYYDKNNWRVVDDETSFNSGMDNMVIWDEKSPNGEIHIHTEWLKSSPSGNDWDRQKTINQKNPDAWGVVIDGRGLFLYNASDKDGQYNPSSIYIGKNSFKDGEKNK